LRETGAYDRIRDELQKDAATYKSKDPEKRKKSLKREITKLEAQLKILQNEANRRSLAPEFSQKFPELRYETLLNEKTKQIQQEIDRIRSLPSPKVALGRKSCPKGRGSDGSRSCPYYNRYLKC
jgi:hypothetical protein